MWLPLVDVERVELKPSHNCKALKFLVQPKGMIQDLYVETHQAKLLQLEYLVIFELSFTLWNHTGIHKSVFLSTELRKTPQSIVKENL